MGKIDRKGDRRWYQYGCGQWAGFSLAGCTVKPVTEWVEGLCC